MSNLLFSLVPMILASLILPQFVPLLSVDTSTVAAALVMGSAQRPEVELAVQPQQDTAETSRDSEITATVEVDFAVFYEVDDLTYTKVHFAHFDDEFPVIGQADDCTWLKVQAPGGLRLWTNGDPMLIATSVPCAQIPASMTPPPALTELQRYAPQRANETRVYMATFADSEDAMDIATFTVIATDHEVDGELFTVTQHRSVDPLGPRYIEYERVTDGEFLFYRLEEYLNEDPLVTEYDPPLAFLQTPLVEGREWWSRSRLGDGESIGRSFIVEERGEITIGESVYPDCVSVLSSEQRQPVYRAIRCPDIGLIAYDLNTPLGWAHGELMVITNARLEITRSSAATDDECLYMITPYGFDDDEVLQTVIAPPTGDPTEIPAMPVGATLLVPFTPEDEVGIWLIECVGLRHDALSLLQWTGICPPLVAPTGGWGSMPGVPDSDAVPATVPADDLATESSPALPHTGPSESGEEDTDEQTSTGMEAAALQAFATWIPYRSDMVGFAALIPPDAFASETPSESEDGIRAVSFVDVEPRISVYAYPTAELTEGAPMTRGTLMALARGEINEFATRIIAWPDDIEIAGQPGIIYTYDNTEVLPGKTLRMYHAITYNDLWVHHIIVDVIPEEEDDSLVVVGFHWFLDFFVPDGAPQAADQAIPQAEPEPTPAPDDRRPVRPPRR